MIVQGIGFGFRKFGIPLAGTLVGSSLISELPKTVPNAGPRMPERAKENGAG